MNFKQKVNTRSSRSGNDEISSSSRQFLVDYKVVNSALDNLLVCGSEIFIDFGIKRGVRKLPQSFCLVEAGPPNNQRAVFVGRFASYVSAPAY